MKKVLNRSAVIFSVSVLTLSGAALAFGSVIDSWDTSKVVTDPGPYVDYTTYPSTIYLDTALVDSNGLISWKHGNVQPPGLKVVNGDDVDGTNCIMTTGYNEFDFTDKMCSDPLQSSKRFKLKNTVNAPLDVDYNVIDGPLSSYRILQKWTDVTDKRWGAFTIELGFTVNGQFVPSTPGDGLGFSDSRGRYFERPTTSYQSKADVLSAYYAQGLAGPADKYHPETGYFNTIDRMSFGLIAEEDIITSDGVSYTYSSVFGEWVYSAAAPIAVFWDDDGDINTDNILMANCADPSDLIHVGTHTGDDITGLTCNGQWVTFKEQAGLDSSGVPYPSDGVPKPIALSDLSPVVYTSVTEAIASGDPGPMYMDYIEDAANLGFNFWITVDDNSQWPTPSGFTVRYTPVPVDGPPIPESEVCDDGVDNDLDGLIDCDDTVDCSLDPYCDVPPPAGEICDDGTDNDNDGLIDCADPDCAGVTVAGGTCGAEGKFTTCSDGFDNDGDNDIDCADSGCAKNKSCK